jgi:hypothetical protein
MTTTNRHFHSLGIDCQPPANARKLDPALFDFRITEDGSVELVEIERQQTLCKFNLFDIQETVEPT